MIINTEATNTRRMREHQLGKRPESSTVSYREIDLASSSTAIDYPSSVTKKNHHSLTQSEHAECPILE